MDPAIPAPRDPADPPEPRRNGSTCEFCECRLSASGEVLTRGAKARAMMELDEQFAIVKRERDTLNTRVSELSAEVESLKAAALPPAKAKRYGRFED